MKSPAIIHDEKGLTLVEIIFVIAILGILLSVATITYSGRTDDARESVHGVNLTILQGAVDIFYADHGRYPVNLEELYSNERGPYLRTSVEEIEAGGRQYDICQNSGTVTVTVEEEQND